MSKHLFYITTLVLALSHNAYALEIWTESPINFSKVGAPDLEINQDRITPNVWITRGLVQGIFNIAPGKEASYGSESPIDTEWAFAGLQGNPTDEFGAENYANLTFSTWANALGGPNNLQDNIQNRPGVVHLISDDIYIDIVFTSWETGSEMAYTRASQSAQLNIPTENVPNNPVSLLLFALLLACIVFFVQHNWASIKNK